MNVTDEEGCRPYVLRDETERNVRMNEKLLYYSDNLPILRERMKDEKGPITRGAVCWKTGMPGFVVEVGGVIPSPL